MVSCAFRTFVTAIYEDLGLKVVSPSCLIYVGRFPVEFLIVDAWTPISCFGLVDLFVPLLKRVQLCMGSLQSTSGCLGSCFITSRCLGDFSHSFLVVCLVNRA